MTTNEMLVQQERTKPRQWAGGEPKEERHVTNGAKSADGDEERIKIDFKKAYLRSQLLKKDPGRLGRPGTLSEYISENLPKVIILGLLFLSVLILIVVKNRGDTAALLCIQPGSKGVEEIHFPEVDFKKVHKLVDKGKFRVVKANKWIVVAASGRPTEQIQDMVKLQGWQVVAVGDTETPSNWEVRGAIFLSVETQATLGFRVLAHLPFNSYVRKSVGYLFAIQHGATKIYDADESASILEGDLSKVFDVDLSGPGSREESFLQYLSLNNRTTVNPYIHFGQRSVWPRGLPLDSVSEINPEIYYSQVSRGKQYIQQGLANGFPDVDSVFYHTRKSGSESFDIKFDPHALPVALPQGTMAPVNNFNTLFHTPAFWALMLPVSVNSQVSDIIRGYWAQRLLWEIGGYLVIYPPSIFRVDTLKPHSFEDEKDLHDNVDHLVEFLVSWTSKKPSFFKKVIHLSHSMAEAGFWTAQDVEFTAAWLQDLVSVGYSEPALSVLEADRGRPLTGQSDHREFVPLTLPSIHLGVEEASTVGFEIGNLLRWRNYYGEVVLVMSCSWPVNHTALGWRMLYGRIFKAVVILSQSSDADFGVAASEEWQAYKALPEVFGRYPSAEGFLVMKDHVVLNYWNLLQANKTRLWNLHKVSKAWKVIHYDKNGTTWFLKSSVKRTVKKMVKSLPVHFRIAYRENMDDKHFVLSKSDVFYIPRRLVGDFVELVGLGVKAKLHQELAIPLFFLAMDSRNSFDSEAFNSIVYRTGSVNSASIYSAEVHAVRPWKATDQRELLNVMKAMALGDPLLLEVL